MMVAFAKFTFIRALSMFLQETWLNSKGLLEAFDTIVVNLPQSILAGETAGIITEGNTNMIEYLKSYLAMTGTKRCLPAK